MDINRLREFLVLSEELNYSKAANLLYITQPVLSRHIHALEETLGGQLFLRDTHSVTLTEFGELCAVQIKEAVSAYDTALINIRNAADTSTDALTVGFLDYAVRPFLNDFAAWFHTAHPTIDVDYISGDLDDLNNAVMEERMDLAFLTHIGLASQDIKDLECDVIYKDATVAVFHPTHPFGNKDSITLAELSTCPVITFSKASNPHAHEFLHSLFDRRNLSVQTVKEVTSIESGLFYAKAGLGTFIIPQHLSSLAEDLRTVLISDEGSATPINLVRKKQNPKQSMQTFVHEFKMFYKKV